MFVRLLDYEKNNEITIKFSISKRVFKMNNIYCVKRIKYRKFNHF